MVVDPGGWELKPEPSAAMSELRLVCLSPSGEGHRSEKGFKARVSGWRLRLAEQRRLSVQSAFFTYVCLLRLQGLHICLS